MYICLHNYVNENQISIVCILLYHYFTIITSVPYKPQYLSHLGPTCGVGRTCFDTYEAAAAAGSKTCVRILVRELASSMLQRILSYFCMQIPWVVLECITKFRPNSSRSHKMAVIFNRKITFFHFSPILFG